MIDVPQVDMWKMYFAAAIKCAFLFYWQQNGCWMLGCANRIHTSMVAIPRCQKKTNEAKWADFVTISPIKYSNFWDIHMFNHFQTKPRIQYHPIIAPSYLLQSFFCGISNITRSVAIGHSSEVGPWGFVMGIRRSVAWNPPRKRRDQTSCIAKLHIPSCVEYESQHLPVSKITQFCR